MLVRMIREVVSTTAAPGAIGPYSQAVKASGSFFFMSGQIPLTPSGDLVGESIEAEILQVVANIKGVLAAAGLTPDSLVKTTIFLSSMDYFAEVNKHYATLFTSEPPARSTVAVAGLPRGVNVEIEGIAVY